MGRGILHPCRACGRDRESPAHSTSSRAAVWTRPWRSEEPDRPLAPPATVVDSSREPCRPADTFLNPREKPTTRRNQRHVETLVHVVRAFRSVIRVGIHEDRTVAVDAATKEVREQLIGDGEWPYGSALRRCEADAEEPVVQLVVVPLNFVKESGRRRGTGPLGLTSISSCRSRRRIVAPAHPSFIATFAVENPSSTSSCFSNPGSIGIRDGRIDPRKPASGCATPASTPTLSDSPPPETPGKSLKLFDVY